MPTTSEESIKKLERRTADLEKQVKNIVKDLKAIQERIDHPPSPGYDRVVQPKRPGRR